MILSTVVTTAHLISSFGLGAGGLWALQMDTSCHDTHFHWKALTVSYSQWISQCHTLMALAGSHGMAILTFFFGLCHCIPVISTWRSKWSDWKRMKTVWKREFHVKYKICDNGAANIGVWARHEQHIWFKPYMLFMACSNTSRRPWHGSMCCNGWCSETCRIEWTCGCRTKILRNRGKLLKAILCYSHCLFDVSNLCSGCLSCTGKDRLDLERVTQIYHGTTGEMSEKKMSATAKPEQRPEGPRTPCWLLHLPG